jgi:hypothetical protein
VDEIARLRPTVVAGGHMARLQGNRLHEALAILRKLPTIPMAPLPGQADLDALLLAASTDSKLSRDTVGTETDEPALVSVGA